jgi:hypothetical protein
MDTHVSSCLQGPLTKTRDWWPRADPGDVAEPPAVSNFCPEGTPSSERQAPDADGPSAGRRAADAPIRSELVERVRREIAADRYETPEKWEAALERLRRQAEGGQ